MQALYYALPLAILVVGLVSAIICLQKGRRLLAACGAFYLLVILVMGPIVSSTWGQADLEGARLPFLVMSGLTLVAMLGVGASCGRILARPSGLTLGSPPRLVTRFPGAISPPPTLIRSWQHCSQTKGLRTARASSALS